MSKSQYPFSKHRHSILVTVRDNTLLPGQGFNQAGGGQKVRV